MRKNLLLVLFLLSCLFAHSQIEQDTVVEPPKPKAPKDLGPRRATILSTAFPGLGQIYNRQVWKTPIIWAAEGALIYSVLWNNREYRIFRDAYNARIDTNASTVPFPSLSEDEIRLDRDFYRRNRDLSLIIAILIYGLNILDANVNAHLRGFKITDDLSMKVRPFYYQYNPRNLATGVSLTFNFE